MKKNCKKIPQLNTIMTIILIINMISILTLVSCKKAPGSAPDSEKAGPAIKPIEEIPYTMVVSVDIIRELGYMFAQTRSKKATVLVKPGDNPLTFIPTKEDEKAVLEADVFLYMGLGLEPGIEKLVSRVKHKVRCIPITADLDRDLLLPSKTYREGYDPHIWWGPDVWEKMLLTMTRVFVSIDPAGEFKYASIYLRYGEATNHLNHRFMALWMEAIPEERRFLITLHPAYTYFGRLYGFTVKSILDPFKNTYSKARIQELADFIIEHKIPVIFPEASYSHKPLEELKTAAAEKGYDVAIGPELYSYFLAQDMSDKNYTYLNAGRTMGRTIYDALKIEDMPGVPD